MGSHVVQLFLSSYDITSKFNYDITSKFSYDITSKKGNRPGSSAVSYCMLVAVTHERATACAQ